MCVAHHQIYYVELHITLTFVRKITINLANYTVMYIINILIIYTDIYTFTKYTRPNLLKIIKKQFKIVKAAMVDRERK